LREKHNDASQRLTLIDALPVLSAKHSPATLVQAAAQTRPDLA
jgi:hypothetical protein